MELDIAHEQVLTPYDNFLYALKAKETKRQYPHRLDKFLVFMGLSGTIEEKCNKLIFSDACLTQRQVSPANSEDTNPDSLNPAPD